MYWVGIRRKMIVAPKLEKPTDCVESVSEFVTNDETNSGEVQVFRVVLVVERSLEDSGRDVWKFKGGY